MKSDSEIVKQCKKHKALSQSLLGNQYSTIREGQAFYAGDFMSYKDEITFSGSRGQQRAMVQFNRVKPYVNAVSGFMAQNRRKACYVARLDNEEAQTLYSDYSNAVADYVRENANADQVESQQDRDMLIGGIGAVEMFMTYGEGYSGTDPNGEIGYAPLDILNCFWDAHARRQNLIDARWAGYDKVYHLDEAKKLFSGSKDDDFEEEVEDNASPVRYDSKTGANYRVLEGYEWADEEAKTVKVTFYQWYDVEKFYRCANPLYAATDPALQAQIGMILEGFQTEVEGYDPRAEILILDAELKKQVDEAFGDSVEVFEFNRKVFYSAVLSGDKLFDKFKTISQQGMTIQFKTGDWDAKNKLWTGMVQSMKEPTLYYNKALTELMFTIATNAKGGVMYEESAITDIQQFEANYAKSNKNVVVADGALSGGKIMPKKENVQITGYENIVAMTDASISEVAGIDKGFLGSSEDRDETGVLQRRRIRQVVTSLANYFDSVALYQKENARRLLDFLKIYAENNPGGMIPILGQNGKTQFMKLVKDPFMAEYAVSIQEAPQTPEEKQDYATIMSGMADKLLAIGDPSGKAVLAVAMKYMPLEKTDVQKLTEILMPGQQIDPAYVQQLEKQVQELMSEMNRAAVAKVISEAKLNEAKVIETNAKVQTEAAKATKTLEESQQIDLENKVLEANPEMAIKPANVSI